MAKYHITAKGEPGVCRAKEGNCPLGSEGDHFPTSEAAQAAYEKKQDGATLPRLTKKSDAKISSKYSPEEVKAAQEVLDDPQFEDANGYASLHNGNPAFRENMESNPKFRAFVNDVLEEKGLAPVTDVDNTDFVGIAPANDFYKRVVKDEMDEAGADSQSAMREEFNARYEGTADEYWDEDYAVLDETRMKDDPSALKAYDDAALSVGRKFAEANPKSYHKTSIGDKDYIITYPV